MLTIQRLRNIGISAHIDSGKTTLTERMLFYAGRIHAMREVHDKHGSATMDHHPIEQAHGITISSAVTRIHWNDHDINIIDTPGHVDFTIEVERSLRVLDGAVMVLCAVGGVQSQSLTVDRQMKRYRVPRIAMINKMDRTGANADNVIQQMRDKLNANPLPVQLPIFADERFVGVVDLINMRAVYCRGENGIQVDHEDIPAHLCEAAEHARNVMLDNLSRFDDDLAECLLSDTEPSVNQLLGSIRAATISHQVTPVLMGTAFKNMGVQQVLDAVTSFLPSPADRKVVANEVLRKSSEEPGVFELTTSENDALVGMAFKTVVQSFGQLTFLRVYQGQLRKGESYVDMRTNRAQRFSRLVRIHAGQHHDIDVATPGDIVGVVGIDCASGTTFTGDGLKCTLESMHVPEPVIRLSIEPVRREDADKLAKALSRFRREDPTFQVSTDPYTGQTLIAGMGQLHLDIYVEKLKQEYACDCRIGSPRVAYKQSPTRAVEFNHVLKKRTGGPGQFAHVIGRMVPLPFADSAEDNETFVFVDEVSGGAIPREFIPAAEKGFAAEMTKGPLGEFEVVGVSIFLQDGAFHDVDSSEMAFRQCASEAMRDWILPKAEMVLLEPVMKLDVEVPADFQGSVTGHIASKRGTVTSATNVDSHCEVSAEVPLAELFNYASDLRSMTQGHGSFAMEFLCYRKTPRSIQNAITNSGLTDF